jgi:hypothetical protein
LQLADFGNEGGGQVKHWLMAQAAGQTVSLLQRDSLGNRLTALASSVIAFEDGSEELCQVGILPLQQPQRQPTFTSNGHQKPPTAVLAPQQGASPPLQALFYPVSDLLMGWCIHTQRTEDCFPGPRALRVFPAKGFGGVQTEYRWKARGQLAV